MAAPASKVDSDAALKTLITSGQLRSTSKGDHFWNAVKHFLQPSLLHSMAAAIVGGGRLRSTCSLLTGVIRPKPLLFAVLRYAVFLARCFASDLFLRIGEVVDVDIVFVPEYHPMLLATSHVVEFIRLSWLSHDAVIRAGIMAHGPQPTRPVPVSSNPSWLGLEGYDLATCAMITAWLSFGCNQFMITMSLIQIT